MSQRKSCSLKGPYRTFSKPCQYFLKKTGFREIEVKDPEYALVRMGRINVCEVFYFHTQFTYPFLVIPASSAARLESASMKALPSYVVVTHDVFLPGGRNSSPALHVADESQAVRWCHVFCDASFFALRHCFYEIRQYRTQDDK